MILANQINSIGLTQTCTSAGGRLSESINIPYLTPYQIKYAGLLLKTASSTSYDSGASATYGVAVPCGGSDRPEGWAYTTTTVTSNLPGATQSFYPLDADLTGGSSEYAEDEADFTPVTCCPLAPGEVVAFPLAASQTIAKGDLIAVADGGLVRKGNNVASVWVLGKAMFDVTSTSTVSTSTVKFVPVWVDVYYKSS